MPSFSPASFNISDGYVTQQLIDNFTETLLTASVNVTYSSRAQSTLTFSSTDVAGHQTYDVIAPSSTETSSQAGGDEVYVGELIKTVTASDRTSSLPTPPVATSDAERVSEIAGNQLWSTTRGSDVSGRITSGRRRRRAT